LYPVGWPTYYFDLDGYGIDSTMFPGYELGFWTLFENDTTIDDFDRTFFYGWTAVYDYGVPPGLHHMGWATLTSASTMRYDTFEIGYIDTMWFPPAGHLYYTNGPSGMDYYPDWLPVEVKWWYDVEELISTPIPLNTFLAHTKPNPFRTGTEITFGLKDGADVDIAVYDVSGRRVVTLVKGSRDAGTYTVNWKGTDSFDRKLSAGVYLLRMKAGDYESTRKLLIN
jgi:hypothetical protein